MNGKETDAAQFALAEEAGTRFLEGPAGRQLLRRADDAKLVLEACGSHDVDSVLLYTENLTPGFFDLSSGEAGGILQKLRDYYVRLAVVCPSGSVRFSTRFADMLVEEERSGYFCMFDSPQAARGWLSTPPPKHIRFGSR